jgi:hypothetical protein
MAHSASSFFATCSIEVIIDALNLDASIGHNARLDRIVPLMLVRRQFTERDNTDTLSMGCPRLCGSSTDISRAPATGA